MIECKRKLMWEAHERYRKSDVSNIYEVYWNYSTEKALAYDYCLDLACKLFAYRCGRVKLIGWNSHTFSVGFYGLYDGEMVFVYITKDYDRYIKLSDLIALEKKYNNG